MKKYIDRLREIFGRIPRGLVWCVAAVLAAIFIAEGDHSATGVTLAMAGFVRAPTAHSRGGKFTVGYFVVKNSGGTGFEIPGTGTDPLGASYGTIHEFGSSTKTQWPRDTAGIWSIKSTIVEVSVAFRNILNAMAPATGSTAKNPTLELEDGTQLEGDTGGGGNDDMPYLCVFYLGKAVGGEHPILTFVGQVSRVGGGESDPNNYSTQTIEFNAVDGLGYTPNPPTYDILDDATFAALSGNSKYGYWVDGTDA